MPHATTSICFTKDKKVIITAGRDGYIHFWNSSYELINKVGAESLGGMKFDEITSMIYLADGPSLVFGMSSGQICLYSINQRAIV